MKKILYPILLLATLIIVPSCKDFLVEQQVATVGYAYYDTEKGMEDLINAAYSSLRWKPNGEQSFSLWEYGVDEVVQANDGSNKHYDFYNAQLTSADAGGFLHGLWQNNYQGINSCNLAMEKIPNIKGGIAGLKDDASKNIRIAECRFLRAYYYFQLVQQFGGVPISLKSTEGVQLEYPRSSVADVYNVIINDLIAAANVLPVKPTQYGRASKGAAQHFLAKAYLTRGSGSVEARGQKTTDIDSAAIYADLVIASGTFSLQSEWANLWNITNQNNSEVIFAIQFNTNLLLLNGSGNRVHLYWGMTYDTKPGMLRDLPYGRPFRRIRPSDYLIDVYDRRNDSRFYKQWRNMWISNNAATIPKWTATNAPSAALVGQNKFKVGDTATYVTLHKNVSDLDISKATYNWFPRNKWSTSEFLTNIKHMDPLRSDVATEFGTRDLVVARLAETYLIAAEAYGRKGDYAKAADLVNVLRKRAAYKAGEAKPQEHWLEEGGNFKDVASTEAALLITATHWDADNAKELYPASATDKKSRFINFILNERSRELFGELLRWEDLARTETLVERVAKFNSFATPNIKPYHKLRPIPLAHLERVWSNGAPLSAEGRAKEQNPGY
jgi:starch-binding outer membrane protein, SusD/RagB family